MTPIFYVHTSQTLYESNEDIYKRLSELDAIFPKSHFLKTERALLSHHAKGNGSAEPAKST